MKLYNGADARNFVSKSERWMNISNWKGFVVVTRKKLSFDFVDPISVFGLDIGFCINLLVISKFLSKLRKLSTKELSFLLEVFTSTWRKKRCCVRKLPNWNNLNAQDIFLEPLLRCTFRFCDCEMSKILW